MILKKIPWIFIIFTIFSPAKIAKLGKFKTQKNIGCGEGGGWGGGGVGESNHLNKTFH